MSLLLAPCPLHLPAFPIVPGSPRAAQTPVGVRFCGAPHILGVLNDSGVFTHNPCKASGIPPSEELAVPRTPSASPPSESQTHKRTKSEGASA